MDEQANVRRALGSWLEGPRLPEGKSDLGLPLAPMSLRLAALVLDWLGSLVVASFFTRVWGGGVALTIFYGEILLLTALSGASFGQRLLRLRVVSITGQRLSPLAVILRSILLFLVFPAVIYDRNGRGLHDRAVKSAVVRFKPQAQN